MDITAIISVINSIIQVFSLTWWIILPAILFFPLFETWVIYAHDRSVKKIKWTLLELKVPKDILTTPKAMEQVFASMYGNYSHGWSQAQYYLDGEIDSWFSFEIVGTAHGIHFYVYVPTKLRNMVEAAVYAQYPDAEIHEVEDYTQLMPEVLPNKTYNLWGLDLIFGKDSFYPIRTYPSFEDPQDEKRVDPISTILEVMSGLKGEEKIWYQIVISPTTNDDRINNDWKGKGEKFIEKLMSGKKEVKAQGWADGLIEFGRNLFFAPVAEPVWAQGKTEEKPMIKFLSQAEQDIIKAVDNKISKLGFETQFRFIYLDRAETFSSANATAVMGSVRQFNTQNLNFFRPGKEKTIPSGWSMRLIP
ncbi:MAG: hypothetical protein NTW60_02940, partial [Candidatus Wolfebacteria bacterium]|nr:hypothetical protein [Candidatus Wolfebacteria bacterium]